VTAQDVEAPAPPTPDTILAALRVALKDPGTLAALRRADPDDPPPAFFRSTVGLLDRVSRGSGPARDDLERRWAGIAAALAAGESMLGNVPLGAALARAGVAEMRLLRLLQAHDGSLLHAVRATVHQLVSKGQPFDPRDVVHLILSEGTAKEESVRRNIARQYYRHEGDRGEAQ